MSTVLNKSITPSEQQLVWMQSQVGVIIHLDVQVFEPGYLFRERWGYTPSPSVFYPRDLDTDQWIATAKSAGATYAVLVAKHCSGFSLWPTDAHDYSVKHCPWRNGQGDIVSDFIKSCQKYGLKPGLYCSASVNAYLDVDNPGCVRSGDAEEQAQYNRIVEQQLTELWSRYGELFYIWFDGGVLSVEEGGPDIIPLLKRYQPNAVVFQGPSEWHSLTRWIGNERGEAPDPFWNTTDMLTSDDGTVEFENRGGNPDGSRWVCGEADMPNRDQTRAFQGGWFWREGDEQYLYSVNHLVECYLSSVGRNTNLLLGMVIDPRGLVPDTDVEQFREFGKRIQRIYSEQVGYTCDTNDTLSITLQSIEAPTVLVLKEDVSQGELVRRFKVEARKQTEWSTIWEGTCIGSCRIACFEPLEFEELRVVVLESAGVQQIEFSAWEAPTDILPKPLKAIHT